jgi:release factor glutamine methyltransferase
MWTSLDLINWTKTYFEKKGIESARLEAELLLAAVLGGPRIRLYVDFEKAVPADKLALYREHVKRRGEDREPLQYILGQAQFLDLKLKVTRQVLIPRPETEVLATWAAERLAGSLPSCSTAFQAVDTGKMPVLHEGEIQRGSPAQQALDLCTGSGCLALYLAAKQPAATVHATDSSAEALAIAAENARALQLESRVAFHQGDLFTALPGELKNSFDLLVTNPPYIDRATRDSLQPEVREHEPAQALFADDGGLSIIKRILAGAAEWLKPGAWVGLEFGLDQATAVKDLAEKAGAFEAIEILPDHRKVPRFLTAKKKS